MDDLRLISDRRDLERRMEQLRQKLQRAISDIKQAPHPTRLSDAGKEDMALRIVGFSSALTDLEEEIDTLCSASRSLRNMD